MFQFGSLFVKTQQQKLLHSSSKRILFLSWQHQPRKSQRQQLQRNYRSCCCCSVQRHDVRQRHAQRCSSSNTLRVPLATRTTTTTTNTITTPSSSFHQSVRWFSLSMNDKNNTTNIVSGTTASTTSSSSGTTAFVLETDINNKMNVQTTASTIGSSATAATATTTRTTVLLSQQPQQEERERIKEYHGRIVVTPIPDFVTIREMNTAKEQGTLVEAERNSPTTPTTTTTTSTTTSNDSDDDVNRLVTKSVLIPRNSRLSRATDRDINPISIYGTAEIPKDRMKARLGPIYYQPSDGATFDWCTNTMNEISTPSVPARTTTSSSSDAAASMILKMMEETDEDLLVPKSGQQQLKVQVPPIPMQWEPSMTSERPNWNIFHHLPSKTTNVHLYIYRKQHSHQQRPPPSSTSSLSSPPPILPRPNILHSFDCQSKESVMDTLQRASMQLLQQYDTTKRQPQQQQQQQPSPRQPETFYNVNRSRQQERSRHIFMRQQEELRSTGATTTGTTISNDDGKSSLDDGSNNQEQHELEESISTSHESRRPFYKASVWYINDPKKTTGTVAKTLSVDEIKPTVVESDTTEMTSIASHQPPTPIVAPVMKELNLTNYSNHDLWKLALQTPLAVIFTLITPNDTAQKDQQLLLEESLPKELCFLLETHPPTIYSVTVFDYWSGYNFVGLPVKIHVETLYATNSRVDWYIAGVYYQTTYDLSHSYTPLMAHLHKRVTVLVTPYRKYDIDEQEGEENDNLHYLNHTGIGCEKAYRFQKIVQTLPSNTIVDVRNSWLLDTKQQQQVVDTIPSTTDTIDEDESRKIRVMTYNVLSDITAKRKENQVASYPYVPDAIMDKARRFPAILHEILSYEADVICLQEVDYPMFYTLLYPTLRQYGYEGYYSLKRGVGINEGCAMFWSLKVFAPVPKKDRQFVALGDLVLKVNGSGINETDTAHATTSDNDWSTANKSIWSLLFRRPDLHMTLSTKMPHVAQMVPLYLIDSSTSGQSGHTQRPIWFTNTHLYYHPKASHIRLLQMLLLLRHIDGVVKATPGDIFLCGDLNSSAINPASKIMLDRTVPENYRMSKEHLNTYRDKHLSPSQDVFLEYDDDFPSFTLPDSVPKFQSAIEPVPEFTLYTDIFRGTLDHILFSTSDSNRIQRISSAPMPSIEDVTAATAMPSPNIPSDHVSLVCDFNVKRQ